MYLHFGGHGSTIAVGNCDEMGFEVMMRLVNRSHDLRLGVLVEVEAAHRSHKWARPTTRAGARQTPLESGLPIDRVPPRPTRTFRFCRDLDGLGHHVRGRISIHIIRLTNQWHVVGRWCLWLLIEVDTNVIESCERYRGT